jgi:hypothetical protein
MQTMPCILSGTRYLVLVPILGLALAAGVFFVFGGMRLTKFLVEAVLGIFAGAGAKARADEIPIAILGIAFSREPADLLEYGVGIALPIAALSLFVGLRAWSTRGERARRESTEGTSSSASESPEES